MTPENDPVCEVCGAPAYDLVQDVRELPPEGGWRRWERDGPLHAFCAAHNRPQRQTYLPGTDPGVIDQEGANVMAAQATMRGLEEARQKGNP